ncbi:Coiled-coil domain-containing protein [Fasciola gigantica]|uniref:Coiled-coil domain-containing protein n=1 Tax=Fasciola gigantica TaxID=46835 RepID=A0A504Z205_FASGI|nr:Coiled-coil domain-containing protein [Fasciola gigantica]
MKFRTNSHISSIGNSVPDRNVFIADINNSSKSKTIIMNESDPFDSPVLSRDPIVIQEILNKVEDQYYSMTFDSGKFEIESLAGPSCRELTKMKLRLLLLDRQNKAVSRRVSELVLEKHPMYEAELNGVLSLQSDNWETLALCRRIRRSLKMSDHALVYSRLMVLRNFRRLLRLRRVLRILRQIRVLQQNVQMLDALLTVSLSRLFQPPFFFQIFFVE